MLNIDNPNLTDICKIVGGQLLGNAVNFLGFSIDTRTLLAGNLFIAIKGEKFDGHRFIDKAEQSGSVAVLVSKKVNTNLPQIIVENTITALQTLAEKWRDCVQIPVIAITGSNGKTSLKEMIAIILSQSDDGLKTAGNFNNHLGVPLTLLRLNSTHKWAVIEMGANHQGEIAQLCKIAKPTIGVVSNISNAHIAGFKTLDDTANTKGAIFAGLPKNGVAIMPYDSPYLDKWREMTSCETVITFGDNSKADYFFKEKNGAVILANKNQQIEINFSIKAPHIYCNAVASATAALQLDNISFEMVKSGLESSYSVKGRLQILKHQSGMVVIDDTYNANPSSVQVAIDYLSAQSAKTVKTILVLGDIGELGDEAETAHTKIGQYAKMKHISQLLSVGVLSKFASNKFGGRHFLDKKSLLAFLKNEINSNTTVLIKGSRFMAMDTLITNLLETKQ